jgi:hypothetical protein
VAGIPEQPPQVWTVSAAVRRAVEHSPELAAARLEEGVAGATADGAPDGSAGSGEEP